MKTISIKPSDLGLKDLEIFYHPELFDSEDLEIYSNKSALAKAIVTGALFAVINSSANEKIKTLDKATEISLTYDAINCVDVIESHYINEYEYLINVPKTKYFTNDDLEEIEIVDAYHAQAKKYYPAKNKISF